MYGLYDSIGWNGDTIMDENRDLYFRLNFYILEAMYKKLVKKINVEHGSNISTRNIDIFYKYVMCSNASDYSKYRNGIEGKKNITSTMEKLLLERCKYLKPYIVDDVKLIGTGAISKSWVKKVKDMLPKDILEECEEQVDQLTSNVVTGPQKEYTRCINDADYICCWMYHFIMDNWVEATEAEAKIERIITALESINFDEIDRCSNEALKKYYSRMDTVYQQFKRIYDYKKARIEAKEKNKRSSGNQKRM